MLLAVLADASESRGRQAASHAVPGVVFGSKVYDPEAGSYFINITAPKYQIGTLPLQLLLPSVNRHGSSASKPLPATAGIILALPVEAGGTFTRQYGRCELLYRSYTVSTHPVQLFSLGPRRPLSPLRCNTRSDLFAARSS
eukprot:SAG31_NODE_1465_length_8232_cov_31.250830_2_plen_141_part_00